jgi:exodeoxyribonuclease-5
MTVELSDEQEKIMKELAKVPRNIQILGGYAGTGKTTLIYHLSRKLSDFKVCAFTGKASNVLKRKKIPAATIHSTIYKAVDDGMGGVYFTLVPRYELNCNGFIIDESSMIGREVYEDLLSFNLPVIFVGDHGQLEPVGENNINVMKNPDYTLEKIHRNAGEIAFFAEWIRKGYRPNAFAYQPQYTGEQVTFINKYQYDDYLEEVDQTICAYNSTRVELNMKARELLGFSGDRPQKNERIMCLRNDHKKGLFNGMQGTIEEIYADRYGNSRIKFKSYCENIIDTDFVPNQFNKEKHEFERSLEEPAPFDYAYAITAHKAQGDEWDNVMVLEQKCGGWKHKRWAYTAASRAREKLIWIGEN